MAVKAKTGPSLPFLMKADQFSQRQVEQAAAFYHKKILSAQPCGAAFQTARCSKGLLFHKIRQLNTLCLPASKVIHHRLRPDVQ